ncbi:MAG TPA: SDR family NAD(P)-dependent oxidoreductase [Desulfuromonadaceae bacterium]
MNKPLSGKTAIVTGASSGIGYATAATLAKAGAAVVITARRKERLDGLAAEIVAQGGKALAVAGDAGRGLAGGILDSDESRWQELYQVNVLGAAHLMRRAGHYLAQRKGGDIVVTGSVVGRNISPFSGFYGSSKFAVIALAEAFRREICPHGVRVSVVMPGVVVSGFQKVAGYDEENFGKAVAQFGKPLDPQAIADGIQWLLTLPPHVNVNEIMIRPTGQNYP